MTTQAVALLADLRAPTGRRLLDEAVTGLDAGADLLALATRLRARGNRPELVSAALEQAAFRRRARAKFGSDADRMFFTAAGLEQATRAAVAEHRARRFAPLAGGRVLDLCCGIGGDLIELSRATGDVTGIDQDPDTVAVAAANLEELGCSGRARAEVGDVTTTDLAGVGAAFVDPGRRTPSGRRTFDPRDYSPPFSFVSELAGKVPATCAKVAPGLSHAALPADAEAEWVSSGGDVTELALWFGPLSTGGIRRRATLLPSGATLTDLSPSGTPAGALPEPGTYVHEPDGAVLRAGLVGAVVADLDGWLIDPAIAYVATRATTASPFTHRYVVEGVLPFQLKRLRSHLRTIGTGDVVVKKRGNAVDPTELRARLRLDGNGPTRTLLLTRKGSEPVVIVAAPA